MLKVLRSCYCVPQDFIEGPMVFVWRQPRVGNPPKAGSGRLHERELFVLPNVDRAQTHMRGLFWWVAHEQMGGTMIKGGSLGAELVNRHPGDTRQNLRNLLLDLNEFSAEKHKVAENLLYEMDSEPEKIQEESKVLVTRKPLIPLGRDARGIG